jgi:predicted GIY-YIG superfamily endonuclease
MPRFYVYVLHTDRALADHARHYCGATSDLLGRLVAHATGRGAKITQAFKREGIAWRVASVFVLDHRNQFCAERRVKRQKKTCLFCGICADEQVRCIPGATWVDPESLGIPLTSAELAAVTLNAAEPTSYDSGDDIPF